MLAAHMLQTVSFKERFKVFSQLQKRWGVGSVPALPCPSLSLSLHNCIESTCVWVAGQGQGAAQSVHPPGSDCEHDPACQN